ncbi:ribosomal protein L1p/L10e family-domain-containing protein [Mycena maculata]|uniref:Ribosomal L1 domain-containing protein 1 n=1 Tax=Mycena maculata TaxID=230809 RepID=A0AAD7JK24_9AGAR|nr:ribosomal protein L1p/L10e family-domain-containing protein [Mycena maculata]
MPKDSLIDAHVSLKQCKLAVEALHAHAAKAAEKQQETELLPGKEQNIWLNVTVKKIASAHKFKPVKISIVHPLVDPRTSAICLITKDPQRKYKDLLAENNIKFISRVVGIEKLKGKFKPYEARRMLLKENGLFLTDERIVPLLPKLLGVKWFEAKKQPIPVCLTRKDLKGELERAISSTYMNQNQGTCTSIKISIMSHKPSQVLENLQAALPAIVQNIKGGWDNVQSLLLKTNSSAGLPIWSCDLGDGEGGRWGGLAAPTDEETSSLDADDEMDIVQEKAGKGKKRAVAEEAQAEEPKKKAKGANGKALSSQGASSSDKLGNAVPANGDSPPKSKKRKASLGVVGAGARSKTNKEELGLPTDDTASPATPSDTNTKEGKKGKGGKAISPAPKAAVPSLTNDELKQKRVGKAGEKKKETILKGKSGKSAKDGIIGKKR